MRSRSIQSYSLPQRLVHWTMALLIFYNLLFPDGMNAWHRVIRHGGAPSPEQIASANVHAYIGIAILVLAVLRVCLRLFQGVAAGSCRRAGRLSSCRESCACGALCAHLRDAADGHGGLLFRCRHFRFHPCGPSQDGPLGVDRGACSRCARSPVLVEEQRPAADDRW